MACSWNPYEKYKLAGETESLLTDREQTLNQLMRQAARGRYVKLNIATLSCCSSIHNNFPNLRHS